MKNYIENYIDNIKLNEVLYIFIDESGIYKNADIKKSIKEYSRKGIISQGRDNFNITAVMIPRNRYFPMKKEIANLKTESCIDHSRYKHRTDYSFKSFSKKNSEISYIECMKYFQSYKKILNKYNIKSFSIGYNFKLLSIEEEFQDIYINTVIKLLNEIKYSIANDVKYNRYKKIYLIFEKMADKNIIRKIEEISLKNTNKKYTFLWTDKGVVGNEIVDLICYNNARYFQNDLYLQTNTMLYNFPNHKTKSLKLKSKI